MATNKFTYKTYQEESNYYQKCSYEFEEKNKSLQQRMTDQENQSAQKIHELETQLQLMAEDEKAYEGVQNISNLIISEYKQGWQSWR